MVIRDLSTVRADSLARLWVTLRLKQANQSARAAFTLAWLPDIRPENPPHNWFTEGFGTADLKDAKALELNGL